MRAMVLPALIAAVFLGASSAAHAATGEIDTGTTAWLLTATLFVLMMCLPGLALFYGGVVRAKNVLSVFVQMYVSAGVIAVLWVIYGYSLVVDTTGMVEGEYSFNSFVGGLNKALLAGVDPQAAVSGVPEGVLIVFLMAFAIITPAIVAGAFAERMKFSASILFLALWFTFCYAPVAHMVWGGPGALMVNWDALDFAGGTAVHINSGVAGLAACLVLGKRTNYPRIPSPPHNLVLTLIGASMLWVGWFGFNIGSGLAVNGQVGLVMLNTQLGACAGILGWALMETFAKGKPSALGVASGAIAGLVGITPACAFVGPAGAIVIGILAAAACFYAITDLKHRFGYDDTLDVFGLHGVGGMVGAILTGVFAASSLGGTVEGLNIGWQLLVQTASVVFTIVYCLAFSWVILKLIDKTIGLRVALEDEETGLDITSHHESAYNA